MRGSLPRPVSGSFKVTSRFGRHSLPDMPEVEFDNPGIDAEVAKGATAMAVYAGKVSGVYMVPGFETVVIVNHGNYYTVYGNIASPSVKVGDSVKQGQAIGRVGSADDDDSHGSIHFEVWKNRDKQDPLHWIR
jgi:septal ring factor EnvC (AmiA/AmiB activator)